MSLSTLSSQLASLNATASGGKNVGSSLSNSKRHEDAVGRGIAHSTKHGHSLHSANPIHKPSVLYADSKAASDVPLTTLRENCVSSLRQLAKLTQNDAFVGPRYMQTLVGVHSLNFERGLATRAENEKMDAILSDLLSLLSTTMGESASSSTTSCFSSSLHVLEYLLRRYDIHARSNMAEQLIIATLPHHEQPVFSRILQLVDLASSPTWAFLRPYAAKGCPAPNRMILAKRAAKDNALLLHCCQLAKTASTIHATECDGDSMQPPRRGVSRVISFSAAVVVEALSLQSTNPVNHGSITEPTLRCLLPFVLAACGDTKEGQSLGRQCPDWRGFGHVIASCITEKCVLAPDAREVLATTLVKGAMETERVLENMDRDDDNVDSVPNVLETEADSIVGVLAVLSKPGEEVVGLPVIPTTRRHKHSNPDEYLGCELPQGTFRALLKLKRLAKVLGHLHEARGIILAPFMASVLLLAMKRIPKETIKKTKSASLSLILDLINEKTLRSLWTNDNISLTASVSAGVVTAFARLSDDESTKAVVESGKRILDALRSVNSMSCDAGIAYAVIALCSEKAVSRQRISMLLGLSDGDLASSSDAKVGTSKETSADLLPPRVALEHADAGVRLNAINRLMDEPEMATDDFETLEQAFLRHMNVDDSLDVVIAAGSALNTLIESRTEPLSDHFADMAFSSLYKWTIGASTATSRVKGQKLKKKGDKALKGGFGVSNQNISEERMVILGLSLSIAGHVCALHQTNTHSGNATSSFSFKRLIQAIVAHIDFPFDKSQDQATKKISSTASLALCKCFESPAAKTKGDVIERAKKLLLTNATLVDNRRASVAQLLGPDKRDKESRASFLQRYLWVVMQCMTDAIENAEVSRSMLEASLISDTLSACLAILSLKHEASDANEIEIALLNRCFSICAKNATELSPGSLPGVVTSLVSVQAKESYQKVSAPAIQLLCDNFVAQRNNNVSQVAILMEVALRPALPDSQVDRLLTLVNNYVSLEATMASSGAIDGIIPGLALLGHSEQMIRTAALQLLSNIGKSLDQVLAGSKFQNDVIALKNICALASAKQKSSSLIMDGASALPLFLASAIRISDNPDESRAQILRQCALAAFSVSYSHTSTVESRWLPDGSGEGGIRAAALVLGALELAGEDAFPLALRWKYAGKHILKNLLQTAPENLAAGANICLRLLIDSVSRMLKGVKVDDASSINNDVSNIIISTGPNARGTRARSYSVGRTQGVSFIVPYPDDMYSALLECISYPVVHASNMDCLAMEMCRVVVRDILGSISWGEGVFKKLSAVSRNEIASRMLYLRSIETVDNISEAFLGLPLDASDISRLLREARNEVEYLGSITFLADYIRANITRLKGGTGLNDLVSLLFEILITLSSNDTPSDDVDGAEFARQALLLTLAGLIQSSDASNGAKQRKSPVEKRALPALVDLILKLLDTADDKKSVKSLRPLLSARAKNVALSLLTTLCSQQPASVVGSLVPAMLACSVTPCCNLNHARLQPGLSRTARASFLSVVPVYCQHASAAGLSLFDLLNTFVAKCDDVADKKIKTELFGHIVDALVSSSTPSNDRVSPVGCLIGVVLSNDTYLYCLKRDERNFDPFDDLHFEREITKKSATITFAIEILKFASPLPQVASILQLIAFANTLFLSLKEEVIDRQQKTLLEIDVEYLVKTAVGGPMAAHIPLTSGHNDLHKKMAIMRTILAYLTVIMNSLSMSSVQKFIKKGEGVEAELCLRLWQDVLLLQSTASHFASIDENGTMEKSFWGSARMIIKGGIDCIQTILPAHLFLASATSLIQDSTDPELRSKALRLIAVRGSAVDPVSPEASLFLDMVPMLVQLLNASTVAFGTSSADSSLLLQQSALLTVEALARSLCLPLGFEKGVNKQLHVFGDALKAATDLLKQSSALLHQPGFSVALPESPTCQLMCSAALCTSTLVRLLQARCLPLLPQLMGILLSSLSVVNEAFRSRDNYTAGIGNQARLLQLSILRALVAIAESLPQFFAPYLDQLLSPGVLLSMTLRNSEGESDLGVMATTQCLENILCTKIPIRQLIPAGCKASSKCVESGEIQALLSILKAAVQSASRTDLPAMRNWLLQSITSAYDYECESGERALVLKATNDLLLALVLKLSEAQLRPLYGRLREWRGDLDGEKITVRRHAFWSLSAVLSRELRSIFLPYLSTVVSDTVDELEFAVQKLCATSQSKKLASDKKRRRLDRSQSEDATDHQRIESLLLLQPILLCLEYALKADAHEGGKWTRADDGQRYNALLDPLVKLLQCQVPSTFPIGSSEQSGSASPFQSLVHGLGTEQGNVINCLTALASAAGNEQLWKPLNYAVLEACGNEARSEVRKAGVSCLLSLIQTLGEEYMVLLPECLPVLSELLEESDEEIVALAQQCVSLGEDLLGESLQDSLR